jgi:hypothetical protein
VEGPALPSGWRRAGLGKAAHSWRSREPVTKYSLSWIHFDNPTATKNLKLAALSHLNRAIPNECQKRSPRRTAYDARNLTRHTERPFRLRSKARRVASMRRFAATGVGGSVESQGDSSRLEQRVERPSAR